MYTTELVADRYSTQIREQFPHRDTSNDFKDQTLEIHNLSEKALKKFATTPATHGPRGPEERTVLPWEPELKLQQQPCSGIDAYRSEDRTPLS